MSRENKCLAATLAFLVVVLHVAHLTGLRNALAALVTLWVLSLLLRERRWPPLGAPFLAWLCAGFLSSSWSLEPATSLKAGVYEIVLPIGAFYGAYLVSRQRAGFLLLCGAVGVGLAFLLGVTSVAFLVDRLAEVRMHDASGVGYYYPGPGAASALLAYAFPLGLLLAWDGRAWTRGLGYFVLGCIPLVGLGNQNRMLWIAMVVAAAAFVAWTWRALSNRQRKPIVLSLAVGAAIAVLAVSYLSESRSSYKVSEDVRFEIWREWGEIWRESPLLGYGLGKEVLEQNLGGHLPRSLVEREPNAVAHSHNLILNLALQVGLAGLMVFLLLIGALARAAYQARSRHGLATGAALAALIVAMVAKNATDDVMDHAVIVAFWLYAGMLVGRLAQ